MARIFTPNHPNGKKILCVEDEPFIGELYVRSLVRAGYEVTVEIDGQRGFELAQSDAYDIILLDIMVPTITGIDVLKRLRDPAITPKLHGKIIITTNLDQREEIRANIEKQADGYLVKAEITPRELVGIINAVR